MSKGKAPTASTTKVVSTPVSTKIGGTANPGAGSGKHSVKGSVPRMQTPPPTPAKKSS